MKNYFGVLLQSLQVNKAGLLSERLLSQTFRTYLLTFFIGITLLLGILVGLNWDKSMPLDLQGNTTVVLVDKPIVALQSNEKVQDSFITFTNDRTFYKKFVFFGQGEKPYRNELTLLLLPGIVLMISVITFIFSLLLAVLFTLVGKGLVKKKSFRDLFVISLHYQLVPLLLFFILFSLTRYVYFVPFFYLLLNTIALLLFRGYKFKSLSD